MVSGLRLVSLLSEPVNGNCAGTFPENFSDRAKLFAIRMFTVGYHTLYINPTGQALSIAAVH